MGGSNDALPFRSGSIDLVYFHLSIHYGEPRRSLAEAARVLRRSGTCHVWTLGAEHHRASFLARWFPSVGEIDAARFPDPQELWRTMTEVGFSGVETGTTVEEVRRSAGDWIESVEAGFVSTLQLVGAHELRAGLDAFRATYPDPDESVVYDMRWEWAVATR